MNRRLWILLFVGFSCAAAGCNVAEDNRQQTDSGNRQETDDGPRPASDTSLSSRPLFFAAMIHLEGQLEIPNEQAYRLLNARIQEIVDLFSQYDAKITVESERPYAEAAKKWGSDQLTYALGRGHGVGTHCDFGIDIKDTNQLTDNYIQNKTAVDDLVGADNNLGCSGGWSAADWVQGARAGGFKYLDAPVMFSYLSAPQEARPNQYTDQEIINTYYHDPVPVDFQERIYPRLLKDALDLEEDPDGDLLLISGSLGEISSLSEGRKNCFPRCEVTGEDTATITAQIDLANGFRDSSKVAVIYVHFPLGTLDLPPTQRAGNTAIVTDWLKTMQAYQDAGKIRWQTMKEVYEACMEDR